MRKVLFFSVILTCISITTSAQSGMKMPETAHTYYADIRNVNSKILCKEILETVRKQQGVVYFETHKFPSEYFILKTSIPVPESLLRSWIVNEPVQIVFFDEEEPGLERLLVHKRTNP